MLAPVRGSGEPVITRKLTGGTRVRDAVMEKVVQCCPGPARAVDSHEPMLIILRDSVIPIRFLCADDSIQR